MNSNQLLPHHQALIDGSAIRAEVATARGYCSVITKADAAGLGFGSIQRNVPALLIPVWNVAGELATYQLRPDAPRMKDGKPLKYETPRGSRMVLDVPPAARPWLGDPARPLFVTEGARKADAAVSKGLCCVATLGVWGWRGTNDHGGTTALPDWESIALKGRTVYVAYDSDVMTKPDVSSALSRLCAFLASRGAQPKPVYLPTDSGGTKTGLDDFLAAGHSVDDLLALAEDSLRPGPEHAVNQDVSQVAGPYAIQEGRIGYKRKSRDGEWWTPLATFTARIVEEVIADDGVTERGELVIAGTLADGTPLPPVRVPLSRFEAMSWVTAKWGMRAVLSAGQGNRDKLREAIQLLSSEVVRRREYTHAGWRRIGGAWHYLTAETVIGPDSSTAGVCVRLEGAAATLALPAPPDGAELQVVIRTTLDVLDVAPDHLTVPLLGAAFRAPLNELSPADFVLFLAGPSGVFKSELAALLQRCYGPAFDRTTVPATWAATPNYLERVAFDFKDAVLLIDDFAPAGTPLDVRRYHANADRVIRGAGNVAGRGRMNADNSTRPALPPRALIVSTGEDVPTGHSIRARMLVLDVERGDVDTDCLRRFQVEPDRAALAAAMAAYLRWLASRLDAIRAELPAQQGALRATVAAADAHARTPDTLVNLSLGWRLWLRFTVEAGALTVEEAERTWQRVRAALVAAGRAQAEHQTGEEPARRFLELIAGALASGAAHVAGPNGDAPHGPAAWGWRARTVGTGDYERTEWQPQGAGIGWLADDGLYLEATAAYATAQRLGHTAGTALAVQPKTLWRRLEQAGLLRSVERNRGTRTVRKVFAGRRHDTIHLAPDSLSPTGPAQIAQTDHDDDHEPSTGTDVGADGHVLRADTATPQAETAHGNRPQPPAAGTDGRNGQVGQLWSGEAGRREGRCCMCGAALPPGHKWQCAACVERYSQGSRDDVAVTSAAGSGARAKE